jgi:steroid 5-alpha reductase family enzyme
MVVVLGTYLLALGAAWGVIVLAPPSWHPLLAAFVADVVATLVVFALSMAFDNASLYDPYWSVAPPVIAVWWVAGAGAGGGDAVRQVLVVGLITIWAVRLTGNWAYGWKGLHHVDWRYDQLRATRGWVPWWLVNLGGIQLMPTLVVYLGMLAVWPALVGSRPFGWLDVVATAVTAGAIALEAVADVQLHRFAAAATNRGRILATGVWRRTRHPNYLGEIALWWGLWLFGLAAAPSWWWTVIGPVAMVVLFKAASIPLMDRRSLDRRRGYADHMRQVPALLPRPNRPHRQLTAPNATEHH